MSRDGTVVQSQKFVEIFRSRDPLTSSFRQLYGFRLMQWSFMKASRASDMPSLKVKLHLFKASPVIFP
jgi:hypothetical protein